MICFVREQECHCFFAIFLISENFVHFNDKVFVVHSKGGVATETGYCCFWEPHRDTIDFDL